MNVRLDWTNPCCVPCWEQRNPNRKAVVLIEKEEEVCCYCGGTTTSGIYVRVDPRTIPFPRPKQDD